ncbi:sulfur carrier protein ThiS [Marinomonas sp.]
MSERLTIHLNDQEHQFVGRTLQNLLDDLGREQQGIAIAVDQQVVPKSRWVHTELTSGSQVYIFESIAGG